MKALQIIVLAVILWAPSVGAQGRGEERSAALDSRIDATAGEHAAEIAKPLRIGALAGVGFPRPLAFEGMVRFGDIVALGVEYGTSPTVSISGVNVTMWSLSGDFRLFPFGGSFFLGFRAGYQQLAASTTITIAPLGPVAESATLDTYFVNPRIGLLWTLGPGITLGTEAGVQVPISSNFATTVPASVLALSPDTDRAVRTLGGVLPTVDLLRIGVLF
ncbi:MAG TPA: hypothetical protein VGY54_05585 [Polyangiaceae bacterium]|jgi:hypothetical protein|nr:hypothetical protein [Polyangiaceae bacterium]